MLSHNCGYHSIYILLKILWSHLRGTLRKRAKAEKSVMWEAWINLWKTQTRFKLKSNSKGSWPTYHYLTVQHRHTKMSITGRILRKVAVGAYHGDTVHKVELLWGIQLGGLINRQQWNFHSFAQNVTPAEHIWTQPTLCTQDEGLWRRHESHRLTRRTLVSRVKVGRDGIPKVSQKSPIFLYNKRLLPSKYLYPTTLLP